MPEKSINTHGSKFPMKKLNDKRRSADNEANRNPRQSSKSIKEKKGKDKPNKEVVSESKKKVLKKRRHNERSSSAK